MKRFSLGLAALLLLSTPVWAEGASPADKKPTIEELQKQVLDLQVQLVYWQSAARSYREKYQGETDALVGMKAQVDQQAATQAVAAQTKDTKK